MAKAKNPGKKAKSKKKYVKPKIAGHGSLQSIAERVSGVILCCLTERARAALRSPAKRRSLTRDVAAVLHPR